MDGATLEQPTGDVNPPPLYSVIVSADTPTAVITSPQTHLTLSERTRHSNRRRTFPLDNESQKAKQEVAIMDIKVLENTKENTKDDTTYKSTSTPEPLAETVVSVKDTREFSPASSAPEKRPGSVQSNTNDFKRITRSSTRVASNEPDGKTDEPPEKKHKKSLDTPSSTGESAKQPTKPSPGKAPPAKPAVTKSPLAKSSTVKSPVSQKTSTGKAATAKTTVSKSTGPKSAPSKSAKPGPNKSAPVTKGGTKTTNKTPKSDVSEGAPAASDAKKSTVKSQTKSNTKSSKPTSKSLTKSVAKVTKPAAKKTKPLVNDSKKNGDQQSVKTKESKPKRATTPGKKTKAHPQDDNKKSATVSDGPASKKSGTGDTLMKDNQSSKVTDSNISESQSTSSKLVNTSNTDQLPTVPKSSSSSPSMRHSISIASLIEPPDMETSNPPDLVSSNGFTEIPSSPLESLESSLPSDHFVVQGENKESLPQQSHIPSSPLSDPIDVISPSKPTAGSPPPTIVSSDEEDDASMPDVTDSTTSEAGTPENSVDDKKASKHAKDKSVKSKKDNKQASTARKSKRLIEQDVDTRPKSPGRRCNPRHLEILPGKSVLKKSKPLDPLPTEDQAEEETKLFKKDDTHGTLTEEGTIASGSSEVTSNGTSDHDQLATELKPETTLKVESPPLDAPSLGFYSEQALLTRETGSSELAAEMLKAAAKQKQEEAERAKPRPPRHPRRAHKIEKSPSPPPPSPPPPAATNIEDANEAVTKDGPGSGPAEGGVNGQNRQKKVKWPANLEW